MATTKKYEHQHFPKHLYHRRWAQAADADKSKFERTVKSHEEVLAIKDAKDWGESPAGPFGEFDVPELPEDVQPAKTTGKQLAPTS